LSGVAESRTFDLGDTGEVANFSKFIKKFRPGFFFSCTGELFPLPELRSANLFKEIGEFCPLPVVLAAFGGPGASKVSLDCALFPEYVSGNPLPESPLSLPPMLREFLENPAKLLRTISVEGFSRAN
jgi:hypothetical protein